MAITVVNVTRYQNPDIATTGTFSLSAPAAAGNLLVIAAVGPFPDCTWDPYPPGLTSDADGQLRQSGCNLLPVFPLNDPNVFGYFGGSGVSADLWYVVTAGATSISWRSGSNPSFVVYEVHSPTGWPSNPLDDVEGAGAISSSVAPVTGPALTNTSGGAEIFFQVCAPYSASGSSGNNITAITGAWVLDPGGIYVDGNFSNVAGFAYLIDSLSPTAPTFTGGATHLGYTGVAASFKPATATGPSCPVQLINGNFMDALGNRLAYGTLKLQLTGDTLICTHDGQLVAGRKFNVTLDENGNIAGIVNVEPNDLLLPAGTKYRTLAYASDGRQAWARPQYWIVPSTAATLDVGTLVPSA